MSTEENVVKTTENERVFTPQKIIRILSLMCIVFVFCPMFLVSCGGETMTVDVMTAVGGLTLDGEPLVEPQLLMLICLLIPVVVLVMFFSKKNEAKKVAMLSFVSMVVDFIVWIVFRSTAKKYAEQCYCTFETTIWFYINMISILLIIVLSAFIVIGLVEMETDLVKFFATANNQEILTQMNEKITEMTNSVNQFVKDNVTEKLEKNTEEEQSQGQADFIKDNSEENLQTAKVDEPVGLDNKSVYCTRCGAKLEENSLFCVQCGMKTE